MWQVCARGMQIVVADVRQDLIFVCVYSVFILYNSSYMSVMQCISKLYNFSCEVA